MAQTNTVTTDLIYFSPPTDGSKPFTNINADPATGERPQNWTRVHHTVDIEDLRGKEDSVSLDTAGFYYGKSAATHTAFTNDEEIEREYYPESIDLVKKITGATRIVPFDHSKHFIVLCCSRRTLTKSVSSHSPTQAGRNRRQPSEASTRSPGSR